LPARERLQVKDFAPNGMLEYWNIGKMGFGLRHVEIAARRGYGATGFMAIIVLTR
jgi:hypothetical protein